MGLEGFIKRGVENILPRRGIGERDAESAVMVACVILKDRGEEKRKMLQTHPGLAELNPALRNSGR